MRVTVIPLLLVIPAVSLFSADVRNIPPVTDVDLARYAGRWYEIARMPHFFEKNLVNVTATYSLRPDGRIDVINEGFVKTPVGKRKKIKGVARVPDSSVPGVLKVRFFIFGSEYRIIYLDPGYKVALVTGNSRKYFWLLSRTPVMDDVTYSQFMEKAGAFGFQTERIIRVLQDWKDNGGL